jgi:hypothetical protein
MQLDLRQLFARLELKIFHHVITRLGLRTISGESSAGEKDYSEQQLAAIHWASVQSGKTKSFGA